MSRPPLDFPKRPGARTERYPPLRGLAAIAMPLALASCMSAVTPRAGHPIETAAGRATVFGHVAIRSGTGTVPPTNPGANWASVGPGLHAELRVYLLRASPRRVAVPAVWGSGSFCWQLPPGDYLLAGLPEDDVSAPPEAQRWRPLAALRVPSEPGVWCAGDVVIEATGSDVIAPGPPREEFEVDRVEVGDACEQRASELAARFAPVAALPRTSLMVGVADLAFDHPNLYAEVRARLDAADRGLPAR